MARNTNRGVGKKASAGRTASREQRQRQLINATIDSISKRGFSGTTLESVTKGAGLSHGVVHFHFKNKEDLYDKTLGFLADEIFQIWFKAYEETGPDPADQLAALIDADFHKKVCTPRKLAVWFAFWGQAKYRPNYLKIHSQHDEERYTVFLRIFAELIETSGNTHLDPESVTRTLEAVIDGLWLNLMLYPRSESREACRRDMYVMLTQFFPKEFGPKLEQLDRGER